MIEARRIARAEWKGRKHRQQRRSKSEIKGWGRTHGGEQAAHKANETQQEEEWENGDETEKEQPNRKLTNKRGERGK